jgi:hypothetical protein
MHRLYISEKAKPLMPPTAASRTVSGAPMVPVNPPGIHPIAAPIMVMINGPVMPTTILCGDSSAISSPSRASYLYNEKRVGSLWFPSAPARPRTQVPDAPRPRMPLPVLRLLWLFGGCEGCLQDGPTRDRHEAD